MRKFDSYIDVNRMSVRSIEGRFHNPFSFRVSCNDTTSDRNIDYTITE